MLIVASLSVLIYSHPMDTEIRNSLDRVVGHSACPEQPAMAGMAWSYPWAAMESGHFISLFDPSPQARARMASAASAYGRKTGRKFSTGAITVFEGGRERRTGWWCVRHDGCEVLPPEPTMKQVRAEAERKELAEKRRKAKFGLRGRVEPRIQDVSRLGDYEPDVAPAVTEADPDEAAAWLAPRAAGEVF